MHTVKNRKTGVISTLTDDQYQAYLNNPHLTGSQVTLPKPKVPDEVKELADKKADAKVVEPNAEEGTAKASKK